MALLEVDDLRVGFDTDAGLVRARWAEHLSGRYDWRHQLWDVLMFQAWLEHRGTRG